MPMAHESCKIYMCAAHADCEAEENVLGPIEAEACNVGVMTGKDRSTTVFGKVSVRCGRS